MVPIASSRLRTVVANQAPHVSTTRIPARARVPETRTATSARLDRLVRLTGAFRRAASLPQFRGALHETSLRAGESLEVFLAREVAGVQPIETCPPRGSRDNQTVSLESTQRLLSAIQVVAFFPCLRSPRSVVESEDYGHQDGHLFRPR